MSHQAPTMSSTSKTSPRARHKNHKNSKSTTNKSTSQKQRGSNQDVGSGSVGSSGSNKCRGRCRVQWSEQHVKEGLVLVQESQLARVVKTGPISEHYDIDPKPFAR